MKASLIGPLTLFCLLVSACSENNGQTGDKIDITPPPTVETEISPSSAPDSAFPLNPMDAWCESMMLKSNNEWTKEDAKKFSDHCLYN